MSIASILKTFSMVFLSLFSTTAATAVPRVQWQTFAINDPAVAPILAQLNKFHADFLNIAPCAPALNNQSITVSPQMPPPTPCE